MCALHACPCTSSANATHGPLQCTLQRCDRASSTTARRARAGAGRRASPRSQPAAGGVDAYPVECRSFNRQTRKQHRSSNQWPQWPEHAMTWHTWVSRYAPVHSGSDVRVRRRDKHTTTTACACLTAHTRTPRIATEVSDNNMQQHK